MSETDRLYDLLKDSGAITAFVGGVISLRRADGVTGEIVSEYGVKWRWMYGYLYGPAEGAAARVLNWLSLPGLLATLKEKIPGVPWKISGSCVSSVNGSIVIGTYREQFRVTGLHPSGKGVLSETLLTTEAVINSLLAYFEEDEMDTKALMATGIKDANDAAWRTAGSQFVKLAREPLVGLLTRHLAPNDEAFRGRLAAFLETELGTALLASMLSATLSALPQTTGEVPQKLARELRVRAMADAGDVMADVLLGPLRQVMALYLQDPGGIAKASPPGLDAPRSEGLDLSTADQKERAQ